MRKSLEERFWAKVQKTDSCWLWRGSIDWEGYGRFRVGGANSRNTQAHRVAFQLSGEITKGMNVLHKCNNKACVRPDHLYLGTQRDNARDYMQLNTYPRKVSPADILQIRQMAQDGVKRSVIAHRLGVSKGTIDDYLTGRRGVWLESL